MDNQPANVRLFVMHGGVETFVELVGSAFQHAHSLSASSSAAPLAITDSGASTTQTGGTEASPTGSSGSEEHFGSSSSTGNTARVPRRERASDLSVALTCRELVVECISCLSSALEVRVASCFSYQATDDMFGLTSYSVLSKTKILDFLSSSLCVVFMFLNLRHV